MANTSNNILSAASKSLLLVELKGVGGWSPNARLKDASRVLAAAYNGSERAFRGTENLLPAPYDEEFKELKAAHSDVRTAFYLATMPYGSTVDAKTGNTRADGKRAVIASKIVDGSFLIHMQSLMRKLEEARAKFAEALPGRIASIRAESALGSQFDASRYPTTEQILRGWYYEEIMPEPILDASAVANMGLPPEVARMIEENLARKVEAQVQFGQQQLVEETMKYVKTMVTNLTKLNTWFTGQGEGKRPSIFDSLVDNVRDSLDKLRVYALPGTNEGDSILALVKGIEERLDMDNVVMSDLKNDHKVAAKVLQGAHEASKLIDAWSGTSTVFDEPAAASVPQPKVEAKPTVDMDELLEGFEEEPVLKPDSALVEMDTGEVEARVTAQFNEPNPSEELMPGAAAKDQEEDINDLLQGW